jgi:hypothetical protein
MKKRTSSLPILVIVAVVALVLGSVGTANAAGLTRHTVKVIATKVANKVVTKRAPTLSVAHANTATLATNSTQLNGKGASSYLNSAITVAIPAKPVGTLSTTYNLPAVPAGTYNVTINYSANFSTTADLSCLIQQAGNPTNLIWSYAGTFNTFGWINHSRIVTVAATGALSMFCTVNTGTYTAPIAGGPQNSISFQPIDTVTSGGTATKGADRSADSAGR